MNWLRYAYPKYWRVTTAIPNGGKRPSKTVVTKYAIKTYSPEGSKLKKEGVKAGVSDIIMFIARNGYHALHIEMKVEKGVQSKSQIKWQELIQEQGYKYVICRSIDEFMYEVKSYLDEEAKEK